MNEKNSDKTKKALQEEELENVIGGNMPAFTHTRQTICKRCGKRSVYDPLNVTENIRKVLTMGVCVACYLEIRRKEQG